MDYTTNQSTEELTGELNIVSLDNKSGFYFTINEHNAIVIKQSKEIINFNNSVPIINGIAVDAELIDNSLVISSESDGNTLLDNRYSSITTNSSIIDFSSLGNIWKHTIVDSDIISNKLGDTISDYKIKIDKGYSTDLQKPFTNEHIFFGSKSTVDSTGYNTIKNYDQTVEQVLYRFILPVDFYEENDEDGNLYYYYPILFICGCMISPFDSDFIETYQRGNELIVLSKIPKELLINRYGLLYFKRSYSKKCIYTEIEDKLSCMKSFIVVIKTTKSLSLTTTKPIFTIQKNKLFFPYKSGGLLINKKTYEIFDYSRSDFYNYTLCTIARPTNFYKVRNTNIDDMTTLTWFTSNPHQDMTSEMYIDLQDLNNFELYDFQFEGTSSSEETSSTDTASTDTQYPTGFETLVGGSEATININVDQTKSSIEKSTKYLIADNKTGGIFDSPLLSDLCGNYTLNGKVDDKGIPVGEFGTQKWYLNSNNKWQIYYEEPYWYIGRIGDKPIYRSGDAKYNKLMPYITYLRWWVCDWVNKDTTVRFKVTYVDNIHVQINTGINLVRGTYTLKDTSTIYENRVWKHETNNIELYFDKTDSRWVIATINGTTKTRLYQSEPTFPSSSPCDYLKYEYIEPLK